MFLLGSMYRFVEKSYSQGRYYQKMSIMHYFSTWELPCDVKIPSRMKLNVAYKGLQQH